MLELPLSVEDKQMILMNVVVITSADVSSSLVSIAVISNGVLLLSFLFWLEFDKRQLRSIVCKLCQASER